MHYNKSIPHVEKVNIQEGTDEIIPDIDLLIELLYLQAPTMDDKAQEQVIKFLSSWIKENVPGCTITRDGYGNMYVTKGKADFYPCAVAHVDTMQDYKSDWEIVIGGKFIYGFDNKEGAQCGLGADDRVGVAFCLQMLQKLPVLKVFFPKNEESGCLGDKQANMKFFQDCSLLLQLDRRSYTNDLIEYTNGVQVMSKELKEAAIPIMEHFDYSFNDGTCTDIGELAKRGAGYVSMNVSCGYFNEHSDNEVISLNHLYNAFNIGYEILSTLGMQKRWEWKAEARVIEYPKYPNYYSGPGVRDYSSGRIEYPRYDWNDDWKEEFYLPNIGKGELKGDTSGFEDYEKKQEVWHYSDHGNFSKEDEEYIQDTLMTGCCPVCSSNKMEDLWDGEIACMDCSSIYNIPVGKPIMEVIEDFELMKEELKEWEDAEELDAMEEVPRKEMKEMKGK